MACSVPMMRSSFLGLLCALGGACGAPPPVRPASAPAAQRGPTAAPKRLDLVRLAPANATAQAVVLTALDAELARAFSNLKAKGSPPAYYLSYEATEDDVVSLHASLGALYRSDDYHTRQLDVDVRVGEPKLDNTHPLPPERFPRFELDFFRGVELPIDDDPVAIRAIAWKETETHYRNAVEQLARVRASKAIKVEDEDRSDDFSIEPPATYLEAPGKVTFDRATWETRLKHHSALFLPYPDVYESSVELQVDAETRYLTSTEGAKVQLGKTMVRLTISASTTANDGMKLERRETFDAPRLEDLPTDAEVKTTTQLVIDDLLEMRNAPLADAFVGPAILEGRAAGVMFHEIFGHRVEGHRQKDDAEGQTFAKKIGERVMPDFIDVYDDPTARTLNGTFLNGFYRYDDEGVAAQRASLVDGGILKGFLMSRSPTRGFTRSNGHGRRQQGHRVVARQGNLIVDPARTTTPAELKRLLIEELKKQNKPYGLRFREIVGGYTGTRREGPQAFKVLPIVVYRVYPDGHEQMVRGADIEGTPLTSLSKILAAGNDFAVFNGYCGAESGWVPVSAASPSLLVAQVEVARRQTDKDKPPILPAPAMSAPGGAR
jgi:TldD protein